MVQGISRSHEKWAWTEDSANECARLWNEGESASIIAQKLFTSRSAVIGKIHRMRAAGVSLRETQPIVLVGHLGGVVISKGPHKPRKSLTSYGVKSISIRDSRPHGMPPGRFFVDKTTDKANPLTKGGQALLDLLAARMPGTGVDLELLSRRECRNPTGGSAPRWLFCGNPIQDSSTSSYCAICRPRMWASTSAISSAQQARAA